MKISKDLKIGASAILALLIIYLGMIFLKGLKLFSNDVSYYVEMSDVQGMPLAADVMANGMKVGSVKDITYSNEKQTILVEINVKPDFHIPVATTAYLSKEMLGSPKLNLKLGPDPSSFLNPGDFMKGEAGADLMAIAADMVPQVQALIPKMDSILAALNTLANDPALSASLHNIEQVTSDLKTTTASVNTLLGRDVPQLMSKANGVMDKVDAVTGNLITTTNTINQIDLNGIVAKADQSLNDVQSLTQQFSTKLNSRDNSLGLLMNDNSLAVHLDSTALNASLLLENVRLHPKRFVHFSIFGRKDK